MPVVTPFHDDFEVNMEGLVAVTNRCLVAGVSGIVACGTTGEYHALSHEERVSVMTRIRGVVIGEAQLVAGCNAGTTREAIALGRVGADLGYDAIVLAAPTDFASDASRVGRSRDRCRRIRSSGHLVQLSGPRRCRVLFRMPRPAR